MNRWDDKTLSPRREARYGDRVVDCFADRPASLYAMFAAAVAKNGAGEALVDGGLRYSWQDLHDRSAGFAAGLARRGVKAGDRVVLLVGNRSEFIVALFAIARLGAVAVPVSTRAARPELAYMIANCGAVGIVHDADLADRLPDAGDVPTLQWRITTSPAAGSELFAAVVESGPPPAPAAVREAFCDVPEIERMDISAAEGEYTRLALTSKDGQDLRVVVSELVRANGWTLRELTRSKHSLEDIFVHLTKARKEDA